MYQQRKRRKDRKIRKKIKWKMKKNKHERAQVAGRVLRGQGCCFLVVRSMLSCAKLTDNRRTTKKARRKTSQGGDRDKAWKIKSRPQGGGEISLNLDMPRVSWWSGVLDIAWYVAIYRDIIPRIMRQHKIRYRIHIPNVGDINHMLTLRISRYRTRFVAS